ncbi:MAG: PAS domain S-box protein [Candidatus Hydrogenedentes bacterium]|nr:PAS domain S-box protein [Candidatus Hydrogenedentota bacterium]
MTTSDDLTEEELRIRVNELQRQNEKLRAAVIEKKNAEHEVREANREINRVLESVSTYLWSADVEKNGQLRYRCSSLSDPWACEPAAAAHPASPRGWPARVHPEDREKLERAMARAIEEKVDCVRGEYRIVAPDATLRWVREIITVSESERGIRRLDGIVSDITDCKRSELALYESEEKHRRLHKGMTDGYVCMDMAGHIIETNRPYRAMLGYSEEELARLTNQDLTPANWHPIEAEIVRDQVLSRGYSDVYEKEYFRKGGGVVSVELHTFLQRDAGGNAEAMWAIVRDITTRKRVQHALEEVREVLEKEVDKRTKELEDLNRALHLEILERNQAASLLQKSEERYRMIVETAFEGVWIVDSTGLTVFVNRRLAELLGYAADEMPQRPLDTLVDRDWMPRATESLRRVGQGVMEQYDLKLRRKDGEPVWVIVSASPLFDEDGQYAGALQMLTDITDRKQAEALLEEQQVKLVASSRMASLGVMASGIAHEINNPLATISGAAQQLDGALGASQPDKAHIVDLSAKIIRNVDRIANIVRALRTFAREGSRDPFEKVSIKKIIEDSLTLCTARFKAHGVKMIVPAISPQICVEARPHQVSQVLVNVLSNAHDAVADLPEKWVKISVVEVAGMVEIMVTDAGTRLPAECVEKMFNPFFTTKPAGKGMGLGLSISKSMLEECGGQILVDEQNPNTSFVIRIPTTQANSEGCLT